MNVIHIEAPYDLRRIERLESDAERQSGLLDYVAMMADVEMPDDDTDVSEEADDE